MTTRVGYSRRPAAEAEAIEAYLAEYGPPAAERFRESLERAERQLLQFPDSGTPSIHPGTRRLVVGNFVVSYRRRGINVEVCRPTRSPP